MIGPIGITGAGSTHGVKLRPSGIEVGVRPEPSTRTSAAAELAAQGAPVDTSRVAALRAAIADGSYTIDSLRIADAMIASEVTKR